jgi:signal transduction histidine kinase
LIRTSIQIAEKGIADLDDLSLSLSTDWIMQIGLIEALEEEIEKLKITGLYDVETSFSQNMVGIDAERELLIFRIAQEAFSNIIRHSKAKKIVFSLQYNPDHACITITDDGKGFDSNIRPENKRGGTGLNNIQLRAKVLNARLTIDTMPGKGTSLSVSVPYIINHTTHQN